MKIYCIDGTDMAFESREAAEELIDATNAYVERHEDDEYCIYDYLDYAEIREYELYKNVNDLYAEMLADAIKEAIGVQE